MSFAIDKTSSNGYRCGCCSSSASEDTIWVDTLEQALEHVPKEFPTEGEHSVTTEVTITDGATGKVVASSMLDWPSGYSRGSGYAYTRWRLTLPNGETQEQIVSGTRRTGLEEDWPDGKEPILPLNLVTDKTWTQIHTELAEKQRAEAIRKAEAELARLRG
jgi:hypothetical protein